MNREAARSCSCSLCATGAAEMEGEDFAILHRVVLVHFYESASKGLHAGNAQEPSDAMEVYGKEQVTCIKPHVHCAEGKLHCICVKVPLKWGVLPLKVMVTP